MAASRRGATSGAGTIRFFARHPRIRISSEPGSKWNPRLARSCRCAGAACGGGERRRYIAHRVGAHSGFSRNRLSRLLAYFCEATPSERRERRQRTRGVGRGSRPERSQRFGKTCGLRASIDRKAHGGPSTTGTRPAAAHARWRSSLRSSVRGRETLPTSACVSASRIRWSRDAGLDLARPATSVRR